MDAIVEAALKKWPNVPDCYGWLALDARGDWYMRDERIQAAGPFPRPKGSRIEHDKLKAFIARNYQADAAGRWHFQNGPQRVYVQLEATPWVWRVQWRDGDGAAPQPGVASHTGRAAQVRACWLDEAGRLYLDTDLGPGIVHSQDMLDAARAIECGLWTPQPIDSGSLPQRLGFVRDPAP